MSDAVYWGCRGHCKVCGRPAPLESDGVCYDCLCLRVLNENAEEPEVSSVDPLSVKFHIDNIRRNGGDERKVFDAFPNLPLQRPINFEE